MSVVYKKGKPIIWSLYDRRIDSTTVTYGFIN